MAINETNEISAAEIYSAYPHVDLLPIDPPVPNESPASYEHRCSRGRGAAASFGDTLFLFLLRELNDPGETRRELLLRLERAEDDLRVVHGRLSHKT